MVQETGFEIVIVSCDDPLCVGRLRRGKAHIHHLMKIDGEVQPFPPVCDEADMYDVLAAISPAGIDTSVDNGWEEGPTTIQVQSRLLLEGDHEIRINCE